MLRKVKDYVSYKLKHNYILQKEISNVESYLDSNRFEDLRQQNFSAFFKTIKENKFYKDLYLKYGVNIEAIKSPGDLRTLPTINKDLVRNNVDRIKTGKKLFITKGYTSGTTGSPLVIFRDYKSVIKENAYVWWYRKKTGLNLNDKKISLRGDLDKNTLFKVDPVSNTLYISSYNLNKKNFKKIHELIREFNPKAILGYPSSLYALALLFEEHKVEVKIDLAHTSSESLMKFQEDRIISVFNAKMYDWYGNAERTIALYRDNFKYFEPPLYSINQYKKDKVITTSLINDYFPLVNYEVNDKIITNNNYISSKKSIEIDEIEGRKEDVVILEDGTRIGRLDLVFKGINNIKMAQIIQNKDFSCDVKIVTTPMFSEQDKNTLRKNLEARIGKKTKINILKINTKEIFYNTSGKFSLVKTKIK